MSWLLKIRIAVAAIGIVVWAWAVKVDDPRLRLTGIVMLAVSLALRFLGRRAPRETPRS
ncbi:MAG TPA: hypothetical protein VFO66_07395 [Gemmatimonadaceae bacterium]|nr:hypothetical protein [Gemmatimonadaceae bacterium]